MKTEISTPVVIAVFVVVILALIGLGYYFLRPKPYVPSPGVGGRPMEVPNYSAPGSSPMAPAGVRPGDVGALQGAGAAPPVAPPAGVVPGDVSGAQRSQPVYPQPPR